MNAFKNILGRMDKNGKRKLFVVTGILLVVFVVVPIILMFLHKEKWDIESDATLSRELVFYNETEAFDVLAVGMQNWMSIKKCATSLILSDREVELSSKPDSADDEAKVFVANIENFKGILLSYNQVFSYSFVLSIDDGRSYNMYYGYDKKTFGKEYIFIAANSPESGVTYLCTRPNDDKYTDSATEWVNSIPGINLGKIERVVH